MSRQDSARRVAGYGSPVAFAALTNGARLTGKTAEVFARNARWVRVSMDGWDAKSYAEHRGVSLSEFDKVDPAAIQQNAAAYAVFAYLAASADGSFGSTPVAPATPAR